MSGFAKFSIKNYCSTAVKGKKPSNQGVHFSDELQCDFTETGLCECVILDRCLNVLGVFPLQQTVRRMALKRSL